MDFARRLLRAGASRTLDPILAGCGFLVFVAAQGGAVQAASAQGRDAQSDEWHEDLGIRWSASSVVPPLTISGTVVDVLTGNPIPAAQVFIDGTDTGALTDVEGRFDLEAPGPGAYVLRATRIGYDGVSAAIRLEERAGLWAEIRLVDQGMTPEALRQTPDRLSLPCGNSVVSEAMSSARYQLTREGRFSSLDSNATVGVTRDPSVCQDVLDALPEDLRRGLLAGSLEFHIAQFGGTFVVVECPWPVPGVLLDDACIARPVRREGGDFIFEDVVVLYW